jgi:hypothetical protein
MSQGTQRDVDPTGISFSIRKSSEIACCDDYLPLGPKPVSAHLPRGPHVGEQMRPTATAHPRINSRVVSSFRDPQSPLPKPPPPSMAAAAAAVAPRVGLATVAGAGSSDHSRQPARKLGFAAGPRARPLAVAAAASSPPSTGGVTPVPPRSTRP